MPRPKKSFTFDLPTMPCSEGPITFKCAPIKSKVLKKLLASEPIEAVKAIKTKAVKPVKTVKKRASKKSTPVKSHDDTKEFEKTLVDVIEQLNKYHRHGGVVPIEQVRDTFAKRGMSRETFDAAIQKAERDYVVDLKVANDPARLKDPGAAILVPKRGHLGYVVVR